MKDAEQNNENKTARRVPVDALVSVIDKQGNRIKKVPESPKCEYGHNGYPECGCNNCIDAIQEMNGIKKRSIYFDKTSNQNVQIANFSPSPNSMDVFWYGQGYGKKYGWGMINNLEQAH